MPRVTGSLKVWDVCMSDGIWLCMLRACPQRGFVAFLLAFILWNWYQVLSALLWPFISNGHLFLFAYPLYQWELLYQCPTFSPRFPVLLRWKDCPSMPMLCWFGCPELPLWCTTSSCLPSWGIRIDINQHEMASATMRDFQNHLCFTYGIIMLIGKT